MTSSIGGANHFLPEKEKEMKMLLDALINSCLLFQNVVHLFQNVDITRV